VNESHAVSAPVEGRIGNNATELSSVMDLLAIGEGTRALRGLHDLLGFPRIPLVSDRALLLDQLS